MRGRKVSVYGLAGVLTTGLLLMASGGVASAVSGGGYNPNQNDCPWSADAWNTPANSVPPGCHNFAVNVESGGTTNGDPNSNNTRYAELGINQLPNNPGNPSFGVEENVGDPGTADSPHAGCLSANTDGTHGGTKAPNGCGNNPNGTGFEANYDYYAIYCPAAAKLPVPSTPNANGQLPALYKCAANQPVGQNSLTPDTGKQNALNVILSQGLLVYIGAFDNLDNGEHDGFTGQNHTAGAINGPSDGGALVVSLAGPESFPNWFMSLVGSGPSRTDPEGLANASGGACADSICFEGTTQQQTEYYGCNDSKNSSSSTWSQNGVDGATDPQNKSADDKCAKGTPESSNVYQNGTPASSHEVSGCSGGGPASTETACYTNSNGSKNPGGADAYRQNTPQQVNAEPGIQTYQDPDPQRSPALPFATPGLYAGTCGVYANDGGGDGEPGLSGTLTNGAQNVNPGYIGPSGC